MRMKRCHVIQLAREAQQAENRRIKAQEDATKQKDKPQRKNILARLLGLRQ